MCALATWTGCRAKLVVSGTLCGRAYMRARVRAMRVWERVRAMRGAPCVCWVRVGEHDASRLVGARRTATKNPHPIGVRTAVAVV